MKVYENKTISDERRCEKGNGLHLHKMCPVAFLNLPCLLKYCRFLKTAMIVGLFELSCVVVVRMKHAGNWLIHLRAHSSYANEKGKKNARKQETPV